MSPKQAIESPDVRRRLLELARQAACAALAGQAITVSPRPAITGSYGGMFVTLRVDGKLRGCVGAFEPLDDMADAVEAVTRSALSDPRFAAAPITANDLNRLHIEISVLSQLQPFPNPMSLIRGVHGVVIRRAGKSGCYLPKVAIEQDWSVEELLSNCCQTKAGLPAYAWREPGTDVLVFTADVFSEDLLSRAPEGRDDMLQGKRSH